MAGFDYHVRQMPSGDLSVTEYYDGRRRKTSPWGTFDQAVTFALEQQADKIMRKIHATVSFGPSCHDHLAKLILKEAD